MNEYLDEQITDQELENMVKEIINNGCLIENQVIEILKMKIFFDKMFKGMKTTIDSINNSDYYKKEFKIEFSNFIKFCHEILYCGTTKIKLKSKQKEDIEQIKSDLQKWKMLNKELILKELDKFTNNILKLFT